MLNFVYSQDLGADINYSIIHTSSKDTRQARDWYGESHTVCAIPWLRHCLCAYVYVCVCVHVCVCVCVCDDNSVIYGMSGLSTCIFIFIA